MVVVAAAVLLVGSRLVQTPEVSAAVTSYDRIEVSIGKTGQVFKLASISFTCQSTGEVVAGNFKDHVKDADGPGLHHEVWGGTFGGKCISDGQSNGVDITATPVDPTNALFIAECRFLNTSDSRKVGIGAIKGTNPGIPNGSQDFKCVLETITTVGGLAVDLDGDLGDLPLETAQSSDLNAGVLAGTIAGIAALAVTLGGAAWYARRRWIS